MQEKFFTAFLRRFSAEFWACLRRLRDSSNLRKTAILLKYIMDKSTKEARDLNKTATENNTMTKKTTEARGLTKQKRNISGGMLDTLLEDIGKPSDAMLHGEFDAGELDAMDGDRYQATLGIMQAWIDEDGCLRLNLSGCGPCLGALERFIGARRGGGIPITGCAIGVTDAERQYICDLLAIINRHNRRAWHISEYDNRSVAEDLRQLSNTDGDK